MASVENETVPSSNDSKNDVEPILKKFRKSWKDPRNRHYNLSVVYDYIIRPSLQKDKELSLNESVCSLTMKFYPDDSSAFNDPIYGEFTFCSKDKIESGNKFESWKDSKNRHYNLSIIYNDIIRPSLEEDKELSSDQSVCLLMMKLYPDYSTALEDPLDEKYTFCYGISKGYDEILMQNNILTIFPSKDEVQEKTTLSNQILKLFFCNSVILFLENERVL